MSTFCLNKRFFACLFILLSAFAAAQSSYREPYRPQIHFSPREDWTNDPNGLVFFHGEYHLFFQFNPLGSEWGHMSWGHAISTDLLHWNELPVAIPEKDGEMVFTGSVVIDGKNTSGFCAPGKECLVAIYTGHRQSPQRQTQNIAYSVDDGRTWTRYSGNPVLDLHIADFRDPNVSWDAQEGHWRMAVSLPTEHKVSFYASPDLKKWNPVLWERLVRAITRKTKVFFCCDLHRFADANAKTKAAKKLRQANGTCPSCHGRGYTRVNRPQRSSKCGIEKASKV